MAKVTYKKAVVEMCKTCIYDKVQKGTWREQVENCTATHCPLFPVRPKTMATIKTQRLEAHDDDNEEVEA